MRILHVDTATEWRGGQNQIVITAEGQQTRGHEVLIFANTSGELATRAAAAGLRVHRAAVGRGDISLKTIRAILDAAVSFGPDVIHVHEAHGLVGAVFGANAVEPRPRLIASRRVDFPLGLISRAKYRRMDSVLAVSRAVRNILIEGGLDEERIVLVPEGVKDRPPGPNGPAALQELGIPPGAPVVGNVAQLVDHKDHDTLLRAASHVLRDIPECRFVICGAGPLSASLEDQAKKLGIADRVVFAGFRLDLDDLIPAFDVFCLSSHLEGLGTSILDAMCFSRAVVATSAGGIPDSVTDGETGLLVEPRDDEELARALVKVLNDRALRERFGAAGRKRFAQTMTSDVMVEATLSAYLAAGAGAKSPPSEPARNSVPK